MIINKTSILEELETSEQIKTMNDEKSTYYFIDTHAHLDMIKTMSPDEAVSQSLKENVKYIINVGSTLSGSKKSLEYAGRYENVFATVGIHPHYAKDFNSDQELKLESLIGKKIVAIGETGFDFFRNLSPRLDQERAFTSQIELAIKNNLPVVVHDRDAHEDTLRVLKKYVAGNEGFRAVVHCFSGDAAFALKCIELGFYISFTGVITFPNAGNAAAAAGVVPIERMFLETDAPFLAPQEKRGKENFPRYVKYIAAKLAEIKSLTIEEVAAITSKNAEDFFKLR